MVQSGSKGRILGEFQHSLDEKGRLAIPAKYRALFSEGAVVARGIEPCLVLRTGPAWDDYAAKISSLPTAQADARQIVRSIFSSAAEVDMDKLGRINIPAVLREYAGLNGEVTLAANGTSFEIWDRARWAENQANRADLAQQLERYGI